MRGETETDREVNRDESFVINNQPDVSLAQLEAIDKAIFGDTTSDSTNLTWVCPTPDNQMIRSLKNMTSLLSHMIGKEVKMVEKQIRAAEKVFHG
jgi:hypothetical protein